MYRLIDRKIGPAGFFRCRIGVSIVAAAAIALALPAMASAATQALTVEKMGTGIGTVISVPAGIECGSTCSAPFTEGSTVVLKGASGPNTAAVEWSGCGKVNLEKECSVTMSAAEKVTATFNLQTRPLTIKKNGSGTGTVKSFPAGIECGSTCLVTFTRGTVVTLTGTSGPKTLAPTWSGCESVDAEDKCVVTMSAAREVTVTFNLVNRQLTTSKLGSGTGTVTSEPAGISCGTTCEASFTDGTAVTLTGVAGFHSNAVKWSGCTSVSGENKCLVTMSAAKAVTATFNLEPQYALYTISVQKLGTGFGTVSASPGSIECGSVCSTEFITGTKLTLTATPAEGSVLTHFAGCVATGPTTCETTVKAAKTIKATFTAVGTRTLSVVKAGSGQGTVKSKRAGIDCGATCSSQVAAPKWVYLTAKSAAGSTFAGFSGPCSGTKTCKVRMNEAHSVTATFTAIPSPLSPPRCVVPKLTGKSLKAARRALAAHHCSLGKVKKPKKGNATAPLVVRSSKPGAGASLAAGAKVSLLLSARAKGKQHR
jgi:Divergent InlB B-repeat domain/PASTA domain